MTFNVVLHSITIVEMVVYIYSTIHTEPDTPGFITRTAYFV